MNDELRATLKTDLEEGLAEQKLAGHKTSRHGSKRLSQGYPNPDPNLNLNLTLTLTLTPTLTLT